MPKETGALPQDPLPLATDEHGVIRVGGTRVSLDSIVAVYLDGASPEQIAESFPSVSLADVHSTIAYFLRHRDAVEAYLDQQLKEADEIEREMRQRFQTADLRERLLRRKATRSD